MLPHRGSLLQGWLHALLRSRQSGCVNGEWLIEVKRGTAQTVPFYVHSWPIGINAARATGTRCHLIILVADPPADGPGCNEQSGNQQTHRSRLGDRTRCAERKRAGIELPALLGKPLTSSAALRVVAAVGRSGEGQRAETGVQRGTGGAKIDVPVRIETVESDSLDLIRTGTESDRRDGLKYVVSGTAGGVRAMKRNDRRYQGVRGVVVNRDLDVAANVAASGGIEDTEIGYVNS